MRTPCAIGRRLPAAAITSVAVALVASGSASAAPYDCEASALRATITGQAAEPVVAGRDATTCAEASAGGSQVLPVVASASALSARTSLEGATGPQRAQVATATGGIADLTVAGLPDLGLGAALATALAPVRAAVQALPSALEVRTPDVLVPGVPGVPAVPPLPPVPQLPGVPPVPPIVLPPLPGAQPVVIPGAVVATVDVRQAVTQLLDALIALPTTSLLGLRAASSTVSSRCTTAGAVTTTGTSAVAGLTVLGQELPTNAALERSIGLLAGGSIDPSTLIADDGPLSAVTTPVGGVALDLGVVKPLLQPLLDALPTIEVPAQAATVRVTPAQEVRDGDVLTRRALRVQIAALGQDVLDLVVGEAQVAARAIDCSVPATPTVPTTRPAPTPPPVTPAPQRDTAPDSAGGEPAALQCTRRRLVLTGVVAVNGRVALVGVADRALAGRTVRLVYARTRPAARAVVQPNGFFAAIAALPPRAERATNRARYQAVIGSERSLDLKLARRMQLTGVRRQGDEVVLTGRISGPLARPIAPIRVQRRVSCRRFVDEGTIRPRRDGTFRAVVDGPPTGQAATYRLGTRVRKTTRNPKTFKTFTLPLGVDPQL